MIDEPTKKEIDVVVSETLAEAGMRLPPLLIGDLLAHPEIDREHYDLRARLKAEAGETGVQAED